MNSVWDSQTAEDPAQGPLQPQRLWSQRPTGCPASPLGSNWWSQYWDSATMLLLVDPSPGEGVTGGLFAPSLMQLVVFRPRLAFLTLSIVGAPSGAPASLKEVQWVGGHGLSSGLPTRLSGLRPGSASGLGWVRLLSSCLSPQRRNSFPWSPHTWKSCIPERLPLHGRHVVGHTLTV